MSIDNGKHEIKIYTNAFGFFLSVVKFYKIMFSVWNVTCVSNYVPVEKARKSDKFFRIEEWKKKRQQSYQEWVGQLREANRRQTEKERFRHTHALQ